MKEKINSIKEQLENIIIEKLQLHVHLKNTDEQRENEKRDLLRD